MAGPYTLTIYAMTGDVYGPCTQVVSVGGPAATISGPTSGCQGSTVQLCGPSGDFDYAWTCPDGSTVSTACLSAGIDGDYQLVLTDRTSGCTSAPAVQTVSFTPCTSAVPNCPRPAHFWALQCRHANRRDACFGADALGAIAACVDARATSLDWSAASGGFCATVDGPRPRHLRVRALREFTAVLANVCASSFPPARGPAIGLDPATALTLPGAPATVGDWITTTDAELASLAGRDAHSADVKAAYRRIIHAAWAINHAEGVGIEAPCPGTTAVEDPKDEPEETLAEELADDPQGAIEFERPGPNPFQDRVSVAYVVNATAGENVQIAVYDIAGRLVKELVRTSLAAGRYTTSWDGTGADGRPAGRGLYLVRGRIGAERVELRIMRTH